MDEDPKRQPIYDALSPRKRAASYALGGTEDSLQRPRIRGLAGGRRRVAAATFTVTGSDGLSLLQVTPLF